MKRKSPVNISNSRWLAYAAAGAASTVIGPRCAESAIHYSGHVNQRFAGFDDQAFPLAPGASIVFTHFPRLSYFHSVFFAGDAEVGMVGGSIAGFKMTCRFNSSTWATASNLNFGATIAQRPFTQQFGYLVDINLSYSDCSFAHGEFINDREGYVGFRFDVGNGLQYGWARVHVKNVYGATFMLTDYAYADPGESILAGQKSEKDSGQAEEESLDALACGAAGLTVWRERRAARR